MHKITITIETGNAAFEDYPNELGNILREVAARLDCGYHPSVLFDTNGQSVGTVEIDEEEVVI